MICYQYSSLQMTLELEIEFTRSASLWVAPFWGFLQRLARTRLLGEKITWVPKR